MTLGRNGDWRSAKRVADKFCAKAGVDPGQLIRPAATGEELEIAGEIAQVQLREIQREVSRLLPEVKALQERVREMAGDRGE